jgi:hypothetical protein
LTADPMLGELVGERLHQPDDPVLGRDVGAKEGQPRRPATEPEKTTAPPRPCAIMIGTVAFAMWKAPVRLTSIRSRQVGIDLPRRCGRGHARVGHDDVEAAELDHALPDGGGERVEVTDVDLAGHDPPILFLDQRHGLGEVLRGRSRVLGGVQRASGVVIDILLLTDTPVLERRLSDAG